MLLNYQQTKVKAGRIRKYQAILPNKREETIIAQKTKKSSSDKAQKIQWHPAFYAAAELELKENIEELDLISEYHLSKEPIRIDLLIIKEENADKVMKNGKNKKIDSAVMGIIKYNHTLRQRENLNDLCAGNKFKMVMHK